jgi:hypothetical protein
MGVGMSICLDLRFTQTVKTIQSIQCCQGKAVESDLEFQQCL